MLGCAVMVRSKLILVLGTAAALLVSATAGASYLAIKFAGDLRAEKQRSANLTLVIEKQKVEAARLDRLGRERDSALRSNVRDSAEVLNAITKEPDEGCLDRLPPADILERMYPGYEARDPGSAG